MLTFSAPSANNNTARGDDNSTRLESDSEAPRSPPLTDEQTEVAVREQLLRLFNRDDGRVPAALRLAFHDGASPACPPVSEFATRQPCPQRKEHRVGLADDEFV